MKVKSKNEGSSFYNLEDGSVNYQVLQTNFQ